MSRFGFVVLMSCFLEEDFIDDILMVCETVESDCYYVKMAVAWLLSTAFVNFKDKVYKVLEKRNLDKFTHNKTISKCRYSFRILKEDKEKLIKFSRK